MALYSNQMSKNRSYINKSVNVVDLIRKAKFEEKKEKRHSLLIMVGAFSLLAITGLVISL